MTIAIFKGDDTDAFGNNFITITLDNPENCIISKATFVCGNIKKTFENPVFPLVVNFTSEETSKLKPINTCHLVVYDEFGRQKTCTGALRFDAQSGVI